jgi:hypothetical protein
MRPASAMPLAEMITTALHAERLRFVGALREVQLREVEGPALLHQLPGLLVERFRVLAVDGAGLGSERAVHVHRHIQVVLREDLPQEEEDLLRPAYGERRDDDVPTLPLGLLEDLRQLLLGSAVAFMQAVPVGGFHDQIVGLLDELRVPDDRLVGLAHVPAEQQLYRLPLVFQVEFEEGRAEDVAGVMEDDAHARREPHRLRVLHRREQPDGLAGVVLGVERLDPPAPGAAGLAGAPFRFHLLDVGRIEQHDLSEVTCGRRSVDGTGVARPHQPGQPARVVDMRVSEQDEGYLSRVVGERREVESLLLVTPLMHATIDQEAGLPDLHDVVGPGDFPRSPAHLKKHAASSHSPPGSGLPARVSIDVCVILRWSALVGC